jgi:hypothetical protein
VDGQYADGCECADDAFGKVCANATNMGTIGIGATTSETGVVPVASEQDWFHVTFTGNTSTSYHPKIVLTGDPDLRMNIYSNCSGTELTCADGSGAGVTTWEVSYTGTALATDPDYIAVPPVGAGGEVWVEVYRSTGSPTCTSFTISVSN